VIDGWDIVVNDINFHKLLLTIYYESSTTIIIITTIHYFNVLYLGLFHVW